MRRSLAPLPRWMGSPPTPTLSASPRARSGEASAAAAASAAARRRRWVVWSEGEVGTPTRAWLTREPSSGPSRRGAHELEEGAAAAGHDRVQAAQPAAGAPQPADRHRVEEDVARRDATLHGEALLSPVTASGVEGSDCTEGARRPGAGNTEQSWLGCAGKGHVLTWVKRQLQSHPGGGSDVPGFPGFLACTLYKGRHQERPDGGWSCAPSTPRASTSCGCPPTSSCGAASWC